MKKKTETMLPPVIKNIVSPELLSEFRHAVEDIVVDAVFKQNGAPMTRIKVLVSECFLDPFKELFARINTSGLCDAYCDMLYYGTSMAAAAEDAKVKLSDLAWLVSAAPLHEADRDEIKPSKVLKARRKL